MGLLDNISKLRRHAHSSFDVGLISEMWNWWVNSLAKTLPEWLLYSALGKRPVTTVHLRDGEYIIDGERLDIRPNREYLPKAEQPSSQDAFLLLDRNSVFTRSRRFPAASLHRLKSMMDLQLDHEMLFSRSEILTDTRSVFQFHASSEVQVEQAIARTEIVQAHIEKLKLAGLRIVAVDVADEEGQPSGFRIPAGKCEKPRLSEIAILNRALASTALALLATVAGLVSLSIDRQIDKLGARTASIEPYARQVLMMQQTGHKFVEATLQVQAEASNPTSFARTFETVAALLPDGSWLESFNYRNESVSLTGASTSPDNLIALLEFSKLVSTARFTAPLVTDNRLQADRFQIELTLTAPEYLMAEAPHLEH